MTIREAIDRVRTELTLTTGDNHLSRRAVYQALQASLVTLMDRESKQVYRAENYTTVRLDPERVKLSEFTCIPLDCEVCRVKISDFLYGKSGPIIRYVGPENVIGNPTPFRVVTSSQFQNKLSLDTPTKFAYVEGEYLYLSECIECVKVEYIKDLSTSTGCGILDTEFNIPDFLVDGVFSRAKQQLLIYLQRPLDVTQNKNPNQ